MSVNEDELNRLLMSTPLGGRKVVTLGVLDTSEEAYAIPATAGKLEEEWKVARSLLSSTGRWPVMVTCWGGDIEREDLFSRFYFEEDAPQDDVSPTEIIRRAESLSPEQVLHGLAQTPDILPLEEDLEVELEVTQLEFGGQPSEAEIRAFIEKQEPDSFELDRFLLDWELERGLEWDPKLFRQGSFEPDSGYLVFLPVSSSWDSLAYIHWYGCGRFNTEQMIALGRSWEQRYGAELWAHYGTMLQCFVSTPPETIDQAWSLSREHYLVSPDTFIVPGISIRQYAVGLRSHGDWFLHERP